MKVSVATTLKEGMVVGMRSMPGNPYDGHTLAETLEQVGILTGTDRAPTMAIVDKGYRGAQIEGVRILMSGQKRGITSLSDVLCVRHSMSTRSMNATQDEDNRSSGQGGAAAILSRSA